MTSKMREFKERMKQNLMNKENLINKYKDNPDLKACENFFSELTRILDGKYEVVGSCNQDISRYLIPAGTKEQITYYGKPELSFRISDHWSWYSNVKKCHDISYVQCESTDMPRALPRADERATEPHKGLQVAIQGTDGKYHHVFGYKYDHEKRQFRWVENNPTDICSAWGLI